MNTTQTEEPLSEREAFEAWALRNKQLQACQKQLPALFRKGEE